MFACFKRIENRVLLVLFCFGSAVPAQFIQQGAVLPIPPSFEYCNLPAPSTAVSGDGNTAIVSVSSNCSPYSTSATVIFTRSGGDWAQQTSLSVSGAVALSGDGNTALIGPFIYVRMNQTWSRQSQPETVAGTVAISGDGNTALFSVPGVNSGRSYSPGQVDVFVRSGGNWLLQASLLKTAASYTYVSYPQLSLSNDGNSALIAVAEEGTITPSIVTLQQRSSGTWSQTVQFPTDLDLGVISGDAKTILFHSLSDSSIHPYVYSGLAWVPQEPALPNSAGFAIESLSTDGGTAVLINSSDNGGAGSEFVYTLSNGVWSQYGGKISGVIPNQQLAGSLSSDGNTAIFASTTYALIYARPSAFVKNQTTGPARNNYTGWVGGQLTVGPAPLEVASLGRLFAPGDTASHVLKLIRASDNSDAPNGSVTVNMAGGSPGLYQYAALSSPITLAPQTSYYLVSQETSGGDPFFDYSLVATTADAVMNNPVYYDGSNYVKVPFASFEYVPLNLAYVVLGKTTLSPEAFITSPTGAYSYTSNPTLPVTVAATAAPGFTVQSVQLMVDGAAASSILAAAPFNFELSTVALNDGFHTLTAQVTDSANSVGVSPGLLIEIYHSGESVSLTSPAANTSVSGMTTLSATAAVSTGLTVANIQFQLDGNNIGAPVTTPLYNLVYDFSQVSNGAHTITAIVTDSAGDAVTSPGVTVTNVSLAPATGTPLVPLFTPGASRNNYSGFVGLQFVVGSSPISVTALGRIYIAGNSGTHLLKLVQASTGTDVPGSAISITMSSSDTAGQYNYVTYANPVLLAANASYYVVSQEGTSGNDSWYDIGPVTLTSAVSSANPVYSVGNGYVPVKQLGFAYIGASLLYNVVTPPKSASLVTGQTPTFLRNNYSGFVGMKFTTGGAAVTVTSLGRIFVPGNTQSHTLELLRVSDGSVVATAPVALPGSAAGQYQYATLSQPVTLTANTAYYLVSQESAGGDQWYDYEPVTVTSVASVNGPVYYTSGGWVVVPFPGNSYVPVSMQYTTQAQPGPTVSITSPVPNSSVTGNLSVTAVANASPGLTVVSVQFQIDGVSNGSPLAGPSYSASLNTTGLTTNATHTVSAVATDSAGGSSVSAPVTFFLSSGMGSPFITGQTFGTVRNDFSGYVGMIVTAASPITINQLGRMCIMGNTAFHVLQLVTQTGTVLGSATVNMAGCKPGQYQYGALDAPVQIAAATGFLVVSQETVGGDQWYDYGPVTYNTAIASVNGLTYTSSGNYVLFTFVKNSSYVPMNFLYQ